MDVGKLVKKAEITKYPVRFDHCFKRIILDQMFQGVWYNFVEKPAYKHLTEDQKKEFQDKVNLLLEKPEVCFEWNQQSLAWRKEAKCKK